MDTANNSQNRCENDVTAAPSFIEMVNVGKTYDGSNNVIENLNLSIKEGEFLSLLGPSGSGKTTTLMMLAGFESATEGDIQLRGTSISTVPPFKRNLGMVFQNYALFPHMTVAENVAYPLKRRGASTKNIRSAVSDILNVVNLGSLGNRRPSHLSGGQQQRVALARALVFDPLAVLLDEPLGALDKQLRQRMQLELKHLHQRLGMTAVYVTHDQAEALTMSCRIAAFDSGVIRQIGTPHEIYEYPQSMFVANFVGENNNIYGIVRSIEGSTIDVELDDGAVVSGMSVGVERIGSRTVACVRPERLHLNPPVVEELNVVRGRISEVIYLGDHVMVRLNSVVENSWSMTARVPISLVEDNVSPNASATVGWRSEHARMFGAV